METSTASEETARTAARPEPTDRGHDRAARPRETNSFHHGAVFGTGESDSAVETLRVTGGKPRSFTDHQRQMLANIDAHGDVRGAAGTSTGTTLRTVEGGEAAKPTAAPPAADKAVAAPLGEAAKPVPATPAPEQPDHTKELAEVTSRADRLADHNRKLVAEVERLRTRPAASLDDRMKSLDAIERTVTTDPLGAMRKLIALNAGVEDTSPDVERFLSHVYKEWTERELKLALDPGQKALIEADRNRMLWSRDKREREAQEKAQQAARAEEQDRAKHDEIARGINSRLETANHAEKFPLLMKHARTIDRKTPGELVWMEIRRGIQAGDMDQSWPDERLIDHASKAIETYYQAHRDALVPPAASPTSTAPQTPATVPVADKPADASQLGVRTITNASASVAPPAPPAAAPPTKAKPTKMSEEARRRALAAKHFPDD